MTDWQFAQESAAEELCRIHHFEMKRDGVAFPITVREYVSPKEPTMKFFAQSGRQTNQRTAPFTPCGWGPTMLTALHECVRAIHRFPDEAGQADR